jgi:hypothetical protein
MSGLLFILVLSGYSEVAFALGRTKDSKKYIDDKGCEMSGRVCKTLTINYDKI